MSNIFDLFKKIENPTQSRQITHIIVGLGNPGEEYVFTRHNAGFLAIDYLCEKLGVKCDKIKFKSLVTDTQISDTRVLIMKPQTFMNNSGEAISQACAFYKIPAENVIVIFDDISLDVGKMRIRKKGSAGGHNGIKSIISHLNSDTFPRIKLGVGQKPSPDYDLVSWVLGKIPKENQKALFEALEKCPNALSLMLKGNFDEAMCKFN